MEFCPKCGAILVMKKTKFGCPRCEYTTNEKIKLETTEKVETKKTVAVVDEKSAEVHPVTDYVCPKCKHEKSYFWTRQMRSGDEPESRFYKCVKCKNVVRED